jgi:hypothetical protein
MRWIWLTAVTVVAAAGIFNLFITLLGHMMRPSHDLDTWVLQAFVFILVVYAGALVLVWKGGPRAWRWLMPLAIIVIAGVSFVPEQLHKKAARDVAQAKLAENKAFEAKELAELEARRRDVEARIAAQRPYAPQEALSLVQFISGMDLTYRDLGNHSAAALAVLTRALEGKVVDPNAMVRGPTNADVADEPLFIQFSKFRIRTSSHGKKPPTTRINRLDWAIFKLLTDNGADLSLPEAAGVVEDLRGTVVSDQDPRYIQLR